MSINFPMSPKDLIVILLLHSTPSLLVLSYRKLESIMAPDRMWKAELEAQFFKFNNTHENPHPRGKTLNSSTSRSIRRARRFFRCTENAINHYVYSIDISFWLIYVQCGREGRGFVLTYFSSAAFSARWLYRILDVPVRTGIMVFSNTSHLYSRRPREKR